MDIDRQELLDQIKAELGLDERGVDEFTAGELEEELGVSIGNLLKFIKSKNIPYTRRKALADGRRQYVYKIERIKL